MFGFLRLVPVVCAAAVQVVQVPLYEVHSLSLGACADGSAPPVVSVDGPAGKSLPDIAAFRYEGVSEAGEVMAPVWQIRFSPQVLGVHVLLSDMAEVLRVNGTEAQDSAGFIRVGPNKRHFVGKDDRLFLPVGLNIAWQKGGEEPVAYWDKYFEELAANGGNFARLWLGPNVNNTFNDLALLRHGGRVIDAKAADLVDQVLESASRHGVRVILALESFNTLCPEWADGNCWWTRSIYNELNGGELSGPLGFLGFWNNNRTVEAWRQYVSHVARRWGAYRSVFAWQFFNEVDFAMFDVVAPAYPWHRSMVAHLRSEDLYGHLVSESWGLALGNPLLDHGALFDISTSHEYTRHGRGTQDLGLALEQLVAGKTELYNKPNLVGEFGCDDTNGYTWTAANIHQGMWTPFFAGAAGMGLPWWWDNDDVRSWVMNDVSHFKSFLSMASAQVPIASLHWRPLLSLSFSKAANVFAIEGRDEDDEAKHVLMLLRSRAWSRPCAPNTTSLDVEAFTLTLPLGMGAWNAIWMDPHSGQTGSAGMGSSLTGQHLSVPAFSQDLVFVLSHSAQAISV